MERIIPEAARVPLAPEPAGIRPARYGRGPRRWPKPLRTFASAIALVAGEAVDADGSLAPLAQTVEALARRNDRRRPDRRRGAGASMDYRRHDTYNLTAGR